MGPELLAAFREYLVAPRRRALRATLDAAQGCGELKEGAAIDLAVNMLVGTFYAQYVAGIPFSNDWSERLVDAVLAGLR